MSAQLALEAATAPVPLPVPSPAPPGALAAVRRLEHAVHTARSYGPLRSCTPPQAPMILLAAEVDRRVLPRWQRGGDGHHEWASAKDYLGLPGWTSRQHWLDVVVPAALRLRGESLERRQVSEHMFLQWCDAVSLHAHRRTGRRCIVRPDRLAELMGVAKRSVQRCQKAAEDLGLYVVVVPGRMLTEAEVRVCRVQGSRQRGLSNDAALVVPGWLHHEISMPDFVAEKSHVTPTSGKYRSSLKVTTISSFTQRSAGDTEPTTSARRQQRGRRGASASQGPPSGSKSRSRRVYDTEALALARELVLRLPWLAGTAPGRLEPSLRRFVKCRAPWTAGDLVTAIDARNRRLGRASMTREVVRQPLGLLATYLRDLDVDADHPLGPDYIPDPARPRRPLLSHTQVANQARAEAARTRAQVATPEHAAAAVAAIRSQLRAARVARQPDTLF